MKQKIKKIVTVPENTQLELQLPKVIVKGSLGKIERKFKFKNIELKKEKNSLVLECKAATKRENKMINTIASHVKNMIIGVNEGFEYKLQICFTHFPISVKVDKEKNLLVIKNFLGENKDRTVKLFPDVNINIENDIIILKGYDKERVAQCAANIEVATRIRNKDRRTYQDGLWIISKAGKKI